MKHRSVYLLLNDRNASIFYLYLAQAWLLHLDAVSSMGGDHQNVKEDEEEESSLVVYLSVPKVTQSLVEEWGLVHSSSLCQEKQSGQV